MPWVNRLADAVRESIGLEHGVALPVWDALLAGGYPDLRTLAEEAGGGTGQVPAALGNRRDAAREAARPFGRKGGGPDRCPAGRAGPHDCRHLATRRSRGSI